MNRAWLVLLPLLAGCPRDPVVCAPSTEGETGIAEEQACELSALPEMAVSVTELDFGDVAPGGTVTRAVDLVNDGDYPLGITSVAIGDATVDFAVAYDLAATACAWMPDAPFADNHAFVLDPGCTLPLTLTYTATSPGEVWDALVLRSEGRADPVSSGFQGDLVHGQHVVWLRGATDGEPESDAPYVIGGVIWMEQTAVIEGETVRMGVRVHSPAGSPIVYEWSTDAGGGTFADPTLAEVEFTAPEIARRDAGAAMNIYAVVYDEDGNQDWAFSRVAVWDENVPLYGGCPDEEPAPSGGCAQSTVSEGSAGSAGGCAEVDACGEPAGCGGEGAWLLVLGVAGLSRRRRGPTA